MTIGNLVPWNWGGKSVPVRRRGKGGARDPFASIFEDFFSEFGPSPFRMLAEEENFVPRINVKDTAEALLVTAEVPGMEESDIDVTLNPESLVITGEKKVEHNEKEDEGYHYVERRYGSFQRIIPLNAEIDEDQVHASFKNGVLSVRLPKAAVQADKTRKISIQAK